MFTRCRVVAVGSLGVLFLVGGCRTSAPGGSGNPDGGGNVGDGGSPDNSNAIGRPCNVLADAGQTQAVYNPAAAECPSNLCLKPARSSALVASIDTGATCSAECTRDSDCNGEMRDMNNPMDKRCARGFACGVAFVVGPLCCKKLCLCKDFLGTDSLSTPLTCDPAQNQGLGCQAADSAASAEQPVPSPQQETDFQILIAPERSVDMLFMVDNSPSMDPKQQALAASFPRMIQQLQLLPGGLPDVHIGVISSDIGAGSEGIGGNCNVPLGDKGLLWGNVPTTSSACDGTAPVRATVAPGSCWALAQNPPITNGCGLNSGARWIEDIQNSSGVGRQQNYTGNLADVFSCLATAVGVNGCGYEHQLQSTRVALIPQAGINDANVGFVRPKAYLAVVLVTDEDDCSADVTDVNNNAMFLQRPAGETASMKCAMRGDLCNGLVIPNYDPANGYTPAGGVGFSTPLSNCAPKDQSTPADPAYMPLIPVQAMIGSVESVSVTQNGVTIYKRPEQILVSGIIGWPANNDPSTVNFTIGVDTTSLPAPQNTYWDYMPICTIPSQKSADGNIYKAYGALRLKKFLDAYRKSNNPADQNVFSICNNDFTAATTQIGNGIVKALRPGCALYPLIDTQPSPPPGTARGPLQPECQVILRISCDTPGRGTCLSSGYIEGPVPECKDPSSGLPFDPATVTPTSVQLNSVPDSNRPCWYLYYTTDPVVGCPEAYNGQRITALLPSGTQAPVGTLLAVKCLTCARTDQACPPLHP